MKELFTTKFDDDFREIGVDEEKPEQEIGEYNIYPQMMPWIGNEYETGNPKKILLIGESHYLPDEADECFRTKEGWYYQSQNELDPESVIWTNTRKIVGFGPENWTNGHRLYKEINKIIGNLKKQDYKSDNMFKYVAYYNYFLRPAYPQSCSFKNICEEMDLNVAYDAFYWIVKTIKPDFVFFFSKFAWDSMSKKNSNFEGVKIDYSTHPARPPWNTKMFHLENHSELLTGKEKFEKFLIDNKVFT